MLTAATATGNEIPSGVFDEISPLRAVMVHRPGIEMERLTPQTREQFLFDEVLWLERARAQHDAFTDLLRTEGAEVLELRDLLRDLLEDPDAREELLAGVLDPAFLGAIAAQDLTEALAALPSVQLVDFLVGGITVAEVLELGVQPRSIYLQTLGVDELVLAPLPNHLFTRDTSAWVGSSVSISPMRHTARRRESLHLEAIYRRHPRFQGIGAPLTIHSDDPRHRTAATVEGGDVMVLSEHTVAIGLSERTSTIGVEHLAGRLLSSGTVQRVIAIALPHQRAMMHLDTVTTVVDPETMVRYGLLGNLETFEVERRGERLTTRARAADEMDDALAAGLGVPKLRVLTPNLDAYSAQREQWDDGCNMLAVAPGRVIAYERTAATNDHLRRHGIEVLEFPGDELGRGRGGPRCMSCPIARERG